MSKDSLSSAACVHSHHARDEETESGCAIASATGGGREPGEASAFCCPNESSLLGKDEPRFSARQFAAIACLLDGLDYSAGAEAMDTTPRRFADLVREIRRKLRARTNMQAMAMIGARL